MNQPMLALMIPIMALAIPVAAIVIGGLVKLQKARLEEARLRLDGGTTPEVLSQLDELREELHQVRAELGEVQERLDFTERLLAGRDRKGLPGAQ